MKHWTLDQLKLQLSRRTEVKGWILSQEFIHRRERYFMSDSQAENAALAVDQDREVRSQNVSARIFVRLTRAGRQGEITKKLFTNLPLEPQLDQAIEAALQTDHQIWELPSEIPSKLPQLATTDPRIAEDIERVMSEMTQQISLAVARPRPTRFNSAELFLSAHDQELHLSNGLTHRSSQSRIYVESAFSMTRRDKNGRPESDEFMTTQWAVNQKDLSIGKLFEETADRAEHSLDVVKPVSGKYAVIVDSEVLATLLNGHVAMLSGFNSYSRLPFIKPGQPFIPEATGDLLSITMDPSLEYGADTVALSDQGVLQSPLLLVDKNQVVATLADKQYSDYLGVPVSTARGNLVVKPGTLSYDELTRQAPQVIEILQFSALFADVNSGTFSSEIRLARLHDHDKKTVTYLKGGSLSGSINENFKGVRLSKEVSKRAHFSGSRGQGYFGPDYALLNDVSIVS